MEVWQSGQLHYLGKIEVVKWWPVGSNPTASANFFNGAVSELPSKQWHRKGTMQVRILPAPPFIFQKNALFYDTCNKAKRSLVAKRLIFYGCVVEWFMASVLKTEDGESCPWVQILPHPPIFNPCLV